MILRARQSRWPWACAQLVNVQGEVQGPRLHSRSTVHVHGPRFNQDFARSRESPVLTMFHVFNFRGSGQPRIIPIQRKFPELRYSIEML